MLFFQLLEDSVFYCKAIKVSQSNKEKFLPDIAYLTQYTNTRFAVALVDSLQVREVFLFEI